MLLGMQNICISLCNKIWGMYRVFSSLAGVKECKRAVMNYFRIQMSKICPICIKWNKISFSETYRYSSISSAWNNNVAIIDNYFMNGHCNSYMFHRFGMCLLCGSDGIHWDELTERVYRHHGSVEYSTMQPHILTNDAARIMHIFRDHYGVVPHEAIGKENNGAFCLFGWGTDADKLLLFNNDPYCALISIEKRNVYEQFVAECIICGVQYETYPTEECILSHVEKCIARFRSGDFAQIGLPTLSEFMSRFHPRKHNLIIDP